MPRDNGSSLELCIILLVLGGAVTIFFIPATAPIVLVIVIPVAAISLYVRRASRAERERNGATQQASPEVEESQQEPEVMPVSPGVRPSSDFGMHGRTTPPDVLVQPLSSQGVTRTQAEKGRNSVESLERRIKELEERVRLLRETLATGLTADMVSAGQAKLNGESLQAVAAEGTEELSERALQQLLEALDEKLAKRAISQQLYQRLRDKYLARLSKARGKREAPPEAASSKPRRR